MENVLPEVDDAGFVLDSSINKAVRSINKNIPVLIIIPGELTITTPIHVHVYENDNELHSWLGELLQRKVLIVKPSDEKVQRLNDLSDLLHFDTYVVFDAPEQNPSGVAKSFLSHYPRLSYLDLQYIEKAEAATIKEDFEIPETEISQEESTRTTSSHKFL